MERQSIFQNETIGDPIYSGLMLGGILFFEEGGSPYTFSKASYPGLRAIRARVQAGGGGGGGAGATGASQASLGSGGGGGGYAESIILARDLGESETVTVGAGGTGVSDSTGNTGGSSSFGSLVVALGGVGGQKRNPTGVAFGEEGGQGGIPTDGDLIVEGSPGSPCWGSVQLGIAGNGGSSHLGAGGKGRNTTSATQSISGNVGREWGGGGGGAINSGSVGSALAGADGADGLVIVELYY